MKEELLKIINSFYGNIFTLGITDKDLINTIQKNNNIYYFFMLNINEKVEYENSDNCKQVKNVKIKKIGKKNKKKKIDFTLCEISDCKSHLKTFINDTIYFTKNKIYYYGKTNEYDLEDLIKKYRRYNVIVTITKFSDEFILAIDTTRAKTNKVKAFFYRCIDSISDFFDFLTDFLLS